MVCYQGGDIDIMAAITIRGLPDEVHRALKQRAQEHGRSTEAEVRAILEATVLPPDRLKMGTALAELGRKYRWDLEIERDQTPADGVDFTDW